MTPSMGSSSMEVFLIVMAVLVLMLLMGGLYLLRDRANLRGDPTSSSFLARCVPTPPYPSPYSSPYP